MTAMTEKYMGWFEKRLPEKTYLHGRKDPSVADMVVYNLVTSEATGLNTIKQKLDAFPKCLALVELIKKREKAGVKHFKELAKKKKE
jgi:glutathione S-transferase